eukprot:Gb_25367 [translate_table: standard]
MSRPTLVEGIKGSIAGMLVDDGFHRRAGDLGMGPPMARRLAQFKLPLRLSMAHRCLSRCKDGIRMHACLTVLTSHGDLSKRRRRFFGGFMCRDYHPFRKTKRNNFSLVMGWSPEIALNAYLDAINLCNLYDERRHGVCFKTLTEPNITEMMSALAAGMNAKLMVEICSGGVHFTIGLAAAARQTGGRLVCILGKASTLPESVEAIRKLGLQDTTEFVVGDAKELLAGYTNIDFAVINCKEEGHSGLLDLLRLSPRGAVVVANNVLDRKGQRAYARVFRTRAMGTNPSWFPSIKESKLLDSPHDEQQQSKCFVAPMKKKMNKTKSWIIEVDERTGEEHVFRVCRNCSKAKQGSLQRSN